MSFVGEDLHVSCVDLDGSVPQESCILFEVRSF